jgi:hypothetical protein
MKSSIVAGDKCKKDVNSDVQKRISNWMKCALIED